jgi:hypothetical protein
VRRPQETGLFFAGKNNTKSLLPPGLASRHFPVATRSGNLDGTGGRGGGDVAPFLRPGDGVLTLLWNALPAKQGTSAAAGRKSASRAVFRPAALDTAAAIAQETFFTFDGIGIVPPTFPRPEAP